jgi:hypothetical protein
MPRHHADPAKCTLVIQHATLRDPLFSRRHRNSAELVHREMQILVDRVNHPIQICFGAAECFAIEACLHNDLRQLGYELRFAGSVYRPLLDAVGHLLYAGHL